MPPATPTADVYSANSGATVRGGRAAPVAPPPGFASVNLVSSVPYTTPDQSMVLQLHGSGTAQTTNGLNYQAACSSDLSYDTTNVFNWAMVRGGVDNSGARVTMVYPWDRQLPNYASGFIRESFWEGWVDSSPNVAANANTGKFCLYTEQRLDAMLAWIEANQAANLSATKRYLTGGSMGGWGSMTYGVRRAAKFAAIYASRPRWRWSETAGGVSGMSWLDAIHRYPDGTSPALWDRASPAGTLQSHNDIIAYASNTANTMPWVGWSCGRNDGYMPFQDHIDAVAAMRAAGRGFCFAWNDGTHGATTGLDSAILTSYPYGAFELGKGYPVFSEHSLDGNPAVDLTGGINYGLSFRNVVETSGTWSCQVMHNASACTVKVKPKSSIYTGNPSPQLVTIPGANTWVTVTF